MKMKKAILFLIVSLVSVANATVICYRDGDTRCYTEATSTYELLIDFVSYAESENFNYEVKSEDEFIVIEIKE